MAFDRHTIRISCVIPTYERPGMLREALASVCAQTYPPCEIIVVNNGVGRLPSDIYDNDCWRVYDILPQAGAAQTRNFGALMASGDYLAFLDDDDIWPADYLDNVCDALAKGVDCVVGRLDKFVEGRVERFKNAYGKLTVDNLLIYNPGITGSNVVIDRLQFFRIKGYDVRLTASEDKSLVIEALLNGLHIEVLPDNAMLQRHHSGARLSDDANMAQGIGQFYFKYRKVMNRWQKNYTMMKISRHRYKSGQRAALFQMMYYKLICKILKLL